MTLEAETGNQQSPHLEVRHTVTDDCRAITGPAKHHDVAGHRHHLEATVEPHRRQIGMYPTNRWVRPAGKGQQVFVEVDADDVDAASGQFDSHSSHATSGVEHTGRMQRLDEVSLTVR